MTRPPRRSRRSCGAGLECGVDVINDGEQPRVGYQTYAPLRLEGFGGASQRLGPSDYTRFPDYSRRWAARFPRRSRIRDTPYAVAEVAYRDLSPAARECDLFDRATAAPGRPLPRTGS